MSTTNILDMNNRIEELEKNSGGGGTADSAKRSDIATEFNTTTSYTAGCFVYHDGKLYQFNADHSAGAWDPTDVVEANVTDQIVSNASAIAGLTASDVAYNNTDSGLTATDAQGAIDEVAGAMLKAIEIPFSSFSWSAGNMRYQLASYTPTVGNLIGFIVTWTNGGTASIIYYNSTDSTLNIGGLLPGGTAITSEYQFKCFEIGF